MLVWSSEALIFASSKDKFCKTHRRQITRRAETQARQSETQNLHFLFNCRQNNCWALSTSGSVQIGDMITPTENKETQKLPLFLSSIFALWRLHWNPNPQKNVATHHDASECSARTRKLSLNCRKLSLERTFFKPCTRIASRAQISSAKA